MKESHLFGGPRGEGAMCVGHLCRPGWGANSETGRGPEAPPPAPPGAKSPESPPFLCPGGIGEAVSSAVVGEPGVTVTRLAISQVPRSGKPAELLKMFGIDKDAIAQAVRSLVNKA